MNSTPFFSVRLSLTRHEQRIVCTDLCRSQRGSCWCTWPETSYSQSSHPYPRSTLSFTRLFTTPLHYLILLSNKLWPFTKKQFTLYIYIHLYIIYLSIYLHIYRVFKIKNELTFRPWIYFATSLADTMEEPTCCIYGVYPGMWLDSECEKQGLEDWV